MIRRRGAEDARPLEIYRGSWLTARRSPEPEYIVYDCATGLPVSGDTIANETLSAAAIQQDEETPKVNPGTDQNGRD
jgi:hypothetical protein